MLLEQQEQAVAAAEALAKQKRAQIKQQLAEERRAHKADNIAAKASTIARFVPYALGLTASHLIPLATHSGS